MKQYDPHITLPENSFTVEGKTLLFKNGFPFSLKDIPQTINGMAVGCGYELKDGHGGTYSENNDDSRFGETTPEGRHNINLFYSGAPSGEFNKLFLK